ncbi:MAG: ATPase [Planctomycetes bacterium]|jgi:formate-dependent phosphoribosylglycinamide formyltransferase (GAR transformylase)|nr:ATPase [Planctomycetota bacterium]MDP6423631.1 ATP-grasp domain-containing protein [Planctomycetota bacterium]
MHVLFVEPAFPKNQREFVRALHSLGVSVTAIGEAPASSLPRELKQQLTGYEQVGSVVDTSALHDAVQQVQERGWVDRLECTVEAHVEPAAQVREACDIPGTSVRTAFLCRDKPAMKEALREAGVPCAQSIGTESPDEVRAFAEEVGYPVILKPRMAAGAAGIYRADDAAQLEECITAVGVDRGASVGVEEFIEGHEGFYDTITIKGRVVHDWISHYYPGVLEAMRTRWISPQIVSTNRIDGETYNAVKELGQKVIDVLGIETSATHMEWFFGPKGLKFSEIGCRPPGVLVWDLYGAGNDLDVYVEWAKAVCHGKTDVRASRSAATGMIALRPDRDGQISGYDGRGVLDKYRNFVIDSHLPPPGTATQGIEHGYMANAWVRMKHPDYDELCRILDEVGEKIQVLAQ